MTGISSSDPRRSGIGGGGGGKSSAGSSSSSGRKPFTGISSERFLFDSFPVFGVSPTWCFASGCSVDPPHHIFLLTREFSPAAWQQQLYRKGGVARLRRSPLLFLRVQGRVLLWARGRGLHRLLFVLSFCFFIFLVFCFLSLPLVLSSSSSSPFFPSVLIVVLCML